MKTYRVHVCRDYEPTEETLIKAEAMVAEEWAKDMEAAIDELFMEGATFDEVWADTTIEEVEE